MGICEHLQIQSDKQHKDNLSGITKKQTRNPLSGIMVFGNGNTEK